MLDAKETSCPYDVGNVHNCHYCGVDFYCESAWLGEASCNHYRTEVNDNDEVEIFTTCSQACETIYGSKTLFTDFQVDENEYKMAKMNRGKLCNCDLLSCCNDVHGCWSPRGFDMEDDRYLSCYTSYHF